VEGLRMPHPDEYERYEDEREKIRQERLNVVYGYVTNAINELPVGAQKEAYDREVIVRTALETARAVLGTMIHTRD
jgi:hypothetical protein